MHSSSGGNRQEVHPQKNKQDSNCGAYQSYWAQYPQQLHSKHHVSVCMLLTPDSGML